MEIAELFLVLDLDLEEVLSLFSWRLDLFVLRSMLWETDFERLFGLVFVALDLE